MTLPILSLLLVLLAAWLSGRFVERFGYPSILGELAAGILLGPAVLGWLEGHPALDILSQVGILLMMAYIGMEMDLAELKRASKGGFFSAIGGFAMPFVLCYAVIIASGGTIIAALFVGMAAGVTALAANSRILLDLQLLDTRIASVMMAGALIADTLSLLVFAGILGLANTGSVDLASIAAISIKATIFFAVAVAAGHYGFPLLGRLVSKSGPLSANAAFIVAALVTLAFAEGAELAGMHGILGAFIAGIFLRDRLFGRTITRSVENGLKQISLGFLAPIFFVTAGFSVSLGVIFDSPGMLLALLGLATLGKIVGSALFYLPTGHGWREGLVIGGGMNGRGAVEIVIAQIGLSLGLIDQEIFSILVFIAIATTATVPIMLRRGVAWLDRHGQLVRAIDRRTGTLVVGAGPTARTFAALLARTEGSGPVRLVDRNTEACAAARALGLDVVEGDAMDEDVLAQAGAASVRSLVALTPNPEVNALVSRVAQASFRIPNILVHHEGRWTGAVALSGLSGSSGLAGSPAASGLSGSSGASGLSAAASAGESEAASGHDAVLMHTGASTAFGTPFHLADWDYWFDNGRTDISTYVVDGASAADAVVHKCTPGTPALALLVEREGAAFPVSAATQLQAGDRVSVVRRRADSVVEAPDFATLLRSAPIVVDAGALDRDGLFLLAAERLAETTGLAPATLSRGFLDREESGSTVIADGIAVPHTHLPGVDRVAFVVVRSEVGIRFDDLPSPVFAAFVIATSDDRRTEYLRTLASIARAVSAPGFLGRWKAADSDEAIRELLGGG